MKEYDIGTEQTVYRSYLADIGHMSLIKRRRKNKKFHKSTRSSQRKENLADFFHPKNFFPRENAARPFS